MSITYEKILAADLLLSNFGITPEEYLAAKRTSEASIEDHTESPYLSRKEAAALLRCSCDTVDNLAAAGHLKRVKLTKARCGRVLIERRSLEDFVRQHIVRARRVAK